MNKLLGNTVPEGRVLGSMDPLRIVKRTGTTVECICGRNSVRSDEMVVQCNNCEHLSHSSCIIANTKRKDSIIVLPGDPDYEFVCSSCSKHGVTSFKMVPKAWLQVARLAMYNLQLDQYKSMVDEYGRDFGKLFDLMDREEIGKNDLLDQCLRCLGFVRYSEIVAYVTDHWSELCGDRSVTATWENTLNASMSTHPQLFRPARVAALTSQPLRNLAMDSLRLKNGSRKVTNSEMESFVISSVKCWWGMSPFCMPVEGWLPGGLMCKGGPVVTMSKYKPVPLRPVPVLSDSDISDSEANHLVPSVILNDWAVSPSSRVSSTPGTVPSTPLLKGKHGKSLSSDVEVPGTPVVLIRSSSGESIHEPPSLPRKSGLVISIPQSRSNISLVASQQTCPDSTIGIWSWAYGLGPNVRSDRIEDLCSRIVHCVLSFPPKKKYAKKTATLRAPSAPRAAKPRISRIRVKQNKDKKSPVSPPKPQQRVSWDLDNVVMPYEWLDAPPREIVLPEKVDIPVPNFRVIRRHRKNTKKFFRRPGKRYIRAPMEEDPEPVVIAGNTNEKGCCLHCHTTQTPVWRVLSVLPGKELCNACGLYYWKYGVPRPNHLWDTEGVPEPYPVLPPPSKKRGRTPKKKPEKKKKRRRRRRLGSDAEDTSDEAFIERHIKARAYWSRILALGDRGGAIAPAAALLQAQGGINRSSSSLSIGVSCNMPESRNVKPRLYV